MRRRVSVEKNRLVDAQKYLVDIKALENSLQEKDSLILENSEKIMLGNSDTIVRGKSSKVLPVINDSESSKGQSETILDYGCDDDSNCSLTDDIILKRTISKRGRSFRRIDRSHSLRDLHAKIAVLKKTGIFHPLSSIRIRWDVVLMAAIVYSTIAVPFRIGFDAPAADNWKILENLMDAFFFCDIIVNFRTAFFNKNRELIALPKAIASHYLKGFFVLDVASTIPVELISELFLSDTASVGALRSAKLLRVLRLARLLKLTRLLRLGTMFSKVKKVFQINPSIERLLYLLIILCFCSHWNACAFHWVMLSQENEGHLTWCTAYFSSLEVQLQECSSSVPISDRYISAMYWAFSTMTTVG